MSAMKGSDAIKFLFTRLKGFDRNVLEKVHLISCENGRAVAEFVVEEEHTNPMGSLHGGMSATLVDSVSSMAILTHEKSELLKSVSVDMHLTYYKGAQMGETVEVIADTIKAGKKMAFLEVVLRNKSTGDILVKGLHSKFLLQP